MKTEVHIDHGNWENSINILASALNVQGAPRDDSSRRHLLHSFLDGKLSVIYFHFKFLLPSGHFCIYKIFSNHLIASFPQCKDYNLFGSVIIII